MSFAIAVLFHFAPDGNVFSPTLTIREGKQIFLPISPSTIFTESNFHLICTLKSPEYPTCAPFFVSNRYRNKNLDKYFSNCPSLYLIAKKHFTLLCLKSSRFTSWNSDISEVGKTCCETHGICVLLLQCRYWHIFDSRKEIVTIKHKHTKSKSCKQTQSRKFRDDGFGKVLLEKTTVAAEALKMSPYTS